MSHFAQIDENNVVINIVVGDNDHSNGDEGYQDLVDNLGGVWIKTSYNTHANTHILGGTPLRKNYAVIGGTYDQERDAFIWPKPFESWSLNEETCTWVAPLERPNDDKVYLWNEELQEWGLHPLEEA
jgi:hypothetical protein